MANLTQQIMSKNLVTISVEATLQEAYELMQKKKFRHLPVTDSKQNVIGILSDRDLQRAMSPIKNAKQGNELTFKFDPKFKVKEFMSAPVRSISKEMNVKDAALCMLKEKISMFLVVDQEMKAQGIVTTDDMLKLLVSLLEKDPAQSVGLGHWLQENSNQLGYLD